MEKELIDFMVEHQIQNNEMDLELLNIQLDFYSKLLENAITKQEKEKYHSKLNEINKQIDKKINDYCDIMSIE